MKKSKPLPKDMMYHEPPVTLRPGALDYRAHPSLIAGERVAYRISSGALPQTPVQPDTIKLDGRLVPAAFARRPH